MARREGRVNSTVDGHFFYIFGWRKDLSLYTWTRRKKGREMKVDEKKRPFLKKNELDELGLRNKQGITPSPVSLCMARANDFYHWTSCCITTRSLYPKHTTANATEQKK